MKNNILKGELMLKTLIADNFGLILFGLAGVAWGYALKIALRVVLKLDEFTDKLSTLISVTYEAIHSPDIKVDLTKKKGD